MVGFGAQATLRREKGKNCRFGFKFTRAWVLWGCCRFFVGMPSCTCVLNVMWDIHANGRALIMVGVGERAVLRCYRG